MAADHIALSSHPPTELRKLPTLFSQQGVDRTAFYGNRPYAHLRAEFERRLRTLQQAGEQPDPRDAQITRLKNEITALKYRLTKATSTIAELSEFQTQALARLAAQHDEISRLRTAATSASRVSRLPQRAATIGSCS